MAAYTIKRVFGGSNTRAAVRCALLSNNISRHAALGRLRLEASLRSSLATTAMSEEQLCALHVQMERLMKDLHHSCQWGSGDRWGEYVFQLSVFRYRSRTLSTPTLLAGQKSPSRR